MQEEEYYVFSSTSDFAIQKEYKIEENGKVFNNLYHYLLYYKAIFLGNPGLAGEILTLKESDLHQKVDSLFPKDRESDWRKVVKQVAYKGCYLKFTQHKDLMNELLDTEGTYLIYASKEEVLWGVGLDEKDERVKDKVSWEGFNWLGEILTLLRDDFIRGLK